MADRQGVAVPTLLINAEDDFVCPASLARPDIIVEDQPGALLLVTQSGSHVAFNEGWLGRGAFHMRLTFDFFDAAMKTHFESEAQASPEASPLAGTKGVVVPVQTAKAHPPSGARV